MPPFRSSKIKYPPGDGGNAFTFRDGASRRRLLHSGKTDFEIMRGFQAFLAVSGRFAARPMPFGVQTFPFGAHPIRFGAQTQPFGAHPMPFGPRPAPFGIHPFSFGACPISFVAHPISFGAKSRSLKIGGFEPICFRSDAAFPQLQDKTPTR